jgi:hypothetical protein
MCDSRLSIQLSRLLLPPSQPSKHLGSLRRRKLGGPTLSCSGRRRGNGLELVLPTVPRTIIVSFLRTTLAVAAYVRICRETARATSPMVWSCILQRPISDESTQPITSQDALHA